MINTTSRSYHFRKRTNFYKRKNKNTMYIYNVTINIEDEVHDEWLKWMKSTHIPDMIATEKFTHAKLLKVHVEEETGGSTYSIQYFTDSKATLEKYYIEDASRLKQDIVHLYADKFVAFRTELEVIEEI